MLARIVIFTVIALLSPQLLPGVRVRGVGAAAAVALVFTVLNLVLGWLIGFLLALVTLPAILLTFGLFKLLLPTLVNALLLKLTDAVLEAFHLDGWWPALGMGLLFALGGALASTW